LNDRRTANQVRRPLPDRQVYQCEQALKGELKQWHHIPNQAASQSGYNPPLITAVLQE
jgi:hypothetical protein